MLRLPEHWIWDSWIADDGKRYYHLFFLHAPRDPAGDSWHMVINAWQRGAPRLDDGVWARATASR